MHYAVKPTNTIGLFELKSLQGQWRALFRQRLGSLPELNLLLSAWWLLCGPSNSPDLFKLSHILLDKTPFFYFLTSLASLIFSVL